MKKTLKKLLLNSRKKYFILLVIAFIIGIIISIFIFNKQQQDRNQNVEITFIDSHQALIFWTTNHPTIGYLKYGKEEKNLDQVIYQTSSEPGQVHAVVLENIPIEGGFISIHNKSDSKFLFSKTRKIVFDAEKYLE